MQVKRAMRKIFLLIIVVIFAIANSGCSNASILFPNGRFEKINLKPEFYEQPVKINDNEILFLGGAYRKNIPAKIFKIKERKWVDLKSQMSISRSSYKAIKYDENNVLIVGGFCKSDKLASRACFKRSEIYNIKENKFTRIGDSNFEYYRYSHIFLLKDGRVFLLDKSNAEVFDPKTKKFKIVGEKTVQNAKTDFYKEEYKKVDIYTKNMYAENNTILLPDGRVLIVGSLGYQVAYNPKWRSVGAEYFDPKTNSFVKLDEWDKEIWGPTLVQINKDEVLLLGRYKKQIFNTVTNKFGESTPVPKGAGADVVIPLENNRLLTVRGILKDFYLDEISPIRVSKGIYNYKTNKLKILGITRADGYGYYVIPIGKKKILFIQPETEVAKGNSFIYHY